MEIIYRKRIKFNMVLQRVNLRARPLSKLMAMTERTGGAGPKRGWSGLRRVQGRNTQRRQMLNLSQWPDIP